MDHDIGQTSCTDTHIRYMLSLPRLIKADTMIRMLILALLVQGCLMAVETAVPSILDKPVTVERPTGAYVVVQLSSPQMVMFNPTSPGDTGVSRW